MEEDEDCEIIEMYEDKAPESFVAPTNRASEKMVANFLNVTRKFTETLSDMRHSHGGSLRGRRAEICAQ